MKICLIIPPSPFLLDERVFVQLGILKIASALEQQNYAVDMVDLSGVENYTDVLTDYVKRKDSSTVFGITGDIDPTDPVKDIPVGGLIYVKTKPEICEKRVVIRNRKGETITLSYLQNCHKYHENWLNNEDLPVLTLNGNNDFINCLPTEWLKTIETFITSLTPRIIPIVDDDWKAAIEAVYC